MQCCYSLCLVKILIILANSTGSMDKYIVATQFAKLIYIAVVGLTRAVPVHRSIVCTGLGSQYRQGIVRWSQPWVHLQYGLHPGGSILVDDND